MKVKGLVQQCARFTCVHYRVFEDCDLPACLHLHCPTLKTDLLTDLHLLHAS